MKDTSILEKIVGNNTLVFVFGGMALQFGQIPPFEFVNFLENNFKKSADYIFLIDKFQCWYHKGIQGASKNIEETVELLNNYIKPSYKKVIMIGNSSGGYASILFSSLCKRVDLSISFIPQTKLIGNNIQQKYSDIKKFLNKNVNYNVYGDKSIKHGIHHYDQIKNIIDFPTVKFKNISGLEDLKKIRDNGTLKNIFTEFL